jgi:hypothetical protein
VAESERLPNLDPAELVGLPVDEAVRRVEVAGYRPRVLRPDSVVTMEWMSGRVNLVERNGRVDTAYAG